MAKYGSEPIANIGFDLVNFGGTPRDNRRGRCSP